MEYLYETIRDRLKRRILEGTYPPGSKLPGSRELSAEFDTTAVTVDRALALLVEEGLVKRIPKSGTYVTKPSERLDPLPVADTGLVGVIAFDTSVSVYWSAIIKAMEDALLNAGFHMVVGHSDGNPERAMRYVEDLTLKGIKGFIYVPITVPFWTEAEYEIRNAQVVDRLIDSELPFILFDRFLSTRQASGVAVDNFTHTRDLVRRLLDLGVERPFCFSSSYSLTSGERERGFIEACAERGISNAASKVLRIEADRITPDKYDLIAQGIRSSEADGFFAINSSLGNGLIDVLDGYPELAETPVVGFEDYDMRRRNRFSWLVKFSVYDAGYAAGELLAKKIKEKDSVLWKNSIVDVRLTGRIENHPAGKKRIANE